MEGGAVMEKKELSLNKYQELAMTTCMETSRNPLYMLLMLGEEMGELQGKFSKAIRKGWIRFENNNLKFTNKATIQECQEWDDLVLKEIGDIMWGLAGLCYVMGWKFEDAAQTNLDKLKARKAIGTIDGDGDGIVR